MLYTVPIIIVIIIYRFVYSSYPLSSTSNGGIYEIRWLFPIYGIPESQPVRDSHCLVVECRARDTVEQRLEVHLAGVVPSVGSQHKTVRFVLFF